MKLYLTDDLFYFEEQVKVWRRDYPGGVTITDKLSEETFSEAASESLFGARLTVVQFEKFPTAKKAEALVPLVASHLDDENLVIYITKITQADMKSPLVKAFPKESVVRNMAFNADQRMDYLDKYLPNVPSKLRCAMAVRSEGMDMRSFRSRVMRLRELRATDEASIDREFPPLVKGESFELVPLVEKGTEESLAEALLKASRVTDAGDDPMMVLGTLHWTYRIAYKVAIAPDRKSATRELGLSGYQASRIPELTPERALARHKAVADASEQIRMGRDGFESLSAVLCLLSEMAKEERRTA